MIDHKRLHLGMKITAIHEDLCFEKMPWLKQYIDLNTNLRTQTKSQFELDFFELLNNLVYRKMMANVHNNVEITLISTEAAACKYSTASNYDHCTIFDENLVTVHIRKTSVFFK